MSKRFLVLLVLILSSAIVLAACVKVPAHKGGDDADDDLLDDDVADEDTGDDYDDDDTFDDDDDDTSDDTVDDDTDDDSSDDTADDTGDDDTSDDMVDDDTDDDSSDDTADDTGDDDTDTTPPTVVSNAPEDGDEELKLAMVVTVTFSEPMNQSSVEGAITMDDGTKATIPGTFSWDDLGKTVTFTPDAVLDENTNYTVTIGTGAQDLNGISMEEEYLFGFKSVDLWTRTYNGLANGDDRGRGIAVDDEGNVYVTGHSYVTGEEWNIWVRKYDKNGSEQWAKTHNGSANQGDLGKDIVVDLTGNIYVVGTEWSTGEERNIWIRKYNPDGEIVWTRTYNDLANDWDEGHGIAVDENGNVYVTGFEYVTGEGFNVWIGKYDIEATIQWTVTYDGEAHGNDQGAGIALDENGNVYVTGTVVVSGDYDIWTRKYNSYGTEQWTKTYNGQANSADLAWGVAVDVNGNVYVTAYESVSGQVDIWVRKYDTNGIVLWTRTYNGMSNDNDQGEDIAVDLYGNVYVTGYETVIGQDYNIWIRKYDTDGTEQWTRTHNGPANSDDGGLGIAVGENGNVYVTGWETVNGEDRNIWIRKYDPDGNWSDD